MRPEIPDHLRKVVPQHWTNFIDDIENELAEVTNSIYEGGVSKGLKHGFGQYVMPSGDVFKGNFKNDLRHGSGICKFNNGCIYKGEWREGRPQGQGIFYSSPGEFIEGRFEGWRMSDGQVKLLFANGEFYSGNFKDDCRNGVGTMVYRNGDTYEGEWDKDKRCKYSKLTMADGGTIHGKFGEDKDNDVVYEVTYDDKEGNTFQQVIIDKNTANNSKQKGKGVGKKGHTRSISSSFDTEMAKIESGAFLGGRLNFLTEVNYHNGDKYRGNFKDGRPNGMGTMWYNYSLPGQKGVEFEIAEYQGNWKAGRRDGFGVMTWQDGSVYKGTWRNDLRFEGEMIMSNGFRYRGAFLNDKFHGKAKLLLGTGTIYEGEFE